MPAEAQLVTTVVYGAGALAFAVYALVLTRRYRSAVPLLCVAGALLTVYLEPVVDLLGNALHPPIGQYNVLTTNGHPVPWAVLLGYVWYFGGAILLSYRHLADRTLTRGFVWVMVSGIAAGAALVEQIPLHFGTWVYYGEQWPKVGYMPIWWVFANTAAVTVPFLAVYRLLPYLKRWRQLLIVPLIPSAAFMGHAGAGWPMYNLLGTRTEMIPSWLMLLGSTSTVALTLLLIWAMMRMFDVPENHGA